MLGIAKTGAKLSPPDWLSKDSITLWNEKLAQVAGLKAANELLDVLDTELLAMYCDAVVKYRYLAGATQLSTDDVKALQAWSRIVRDCAEKLGFTPSARARLVKKIADEGKDTFGKKFD
jgi:phage terminase small subunit